MNGKWKWMAGGVLSALCLCLAGCGSKKINLNDYVVFQFQGYESAGTASGYVDIDQLIEDNMEAFGLDEDSSFFDVAKVYDALSGKLKGEVDKQEELSNGDTVTFQWGKINEDALKDKYSVSFSYSDVSEEVYGLDAPTKFNPFDYIEVTFSGMAPNASLKIKNVNAMPFYGINFNADKTERLRNGDTIVITAEASGNLKDYCLTRGYLPTEEKKEYTVSGLSAYAMSLDEIPDEIKEKMLKQAEDGIRANAAGWLEGNSLKQVEHIGYYFLSPKEGFYAKCNNELYCVYKITANVTGVTESNTNEVVNADEVYYTYYYFSDIMLLADGMCSVDLSRGALSGNNLCSKYGNNDTWWGFRCFYYSGYGDLDSMFNECVAQKTESCNYESTVK